MRVATRCEACRGQYPELTALGVEQVQGDLSDPKAVLRAAEGCDTVFHVAAKAGIWGSYREYYTANVVGTENVLAACRALDIGRLVYTGSPSVVFDGRDVAGGDESLPYPDRYEAFYPRRKRSPSGWCLRPIRDSPRYRSAPT